MTLWVIIAALTVAAAGLLLVPLFRRGGQEAARAAFDLVVYRDQLDEVARDLERGVLTEDQAAAARTEIERRLLAAASPPKDERPAAPVPRARLMLAGAAILGPVAALGLYLGLGEPGLPGQPFAERTAASQGGAGAIGGPEIEAMVDRLAARLETQPDDRDGWRMLGRSYMVLQRFGEAAEAYGRAFALDRSDAEAATTYGEAVVYANEGTVTPEARAAFEAALAVEPKQPQARFFMGLAKIQEGRQREALAMWEELAAEAPPEAPWLRELREQIARLKQMIREGG